jgi:DNA-directed RNA polymerase subunit RPC12/RpoP
MKTCSYCGKENMESSNHCSGCGSEFGVASSWPDYAKTRNCCPNCGAREHRQAGVLRRSFNPWLFHVGGLFVSVLYAASNKRQVRCEQCGTLFFIHTRTSRIALVLLVILLALIALGLLTAIFE